MSQELNLLATLFGMPSTKLDFSSAKYCNNRREPCGYYTPPRSFKIAGIESLVVDPHNEVLPHWYKVSNPPAVLVHIDKHPDMKSGVRNIEYIRENRVFGNLTSISEYAKQCLSISDFISAGVHYGLVGVVYYFDPRQSNVFTYGRVVSEKLVNSPKTKLNNLGYIMWDTQTVLAQQKYSLQPIPIPENISKAQFNEDLSGCKLPIILDIDLDAYLCIKDVEQDPSVVETRFQDVKNIISKLPKPTIITIARSQSPTLWCPMDKVNDFERKTIEYLQLLYQKE